MHMILDILEELAYSLHGLLCRLGCHRWVQHRYLVEEGFIDLCMHCRKRKVPCNRQSKL